MALTYPWPWGPSSQEIQSLDRYLLSIYFRNEEWQWQHWSYIWKREEAHVVEEWWEFVVNVHCADTVQQCRHLYLSCYYIVIHQPTILLVQTQWLADQINIATKLTNPRSLSGVLEDPADWCMRPVYRTYTRLPPETTARKHVVSIQQEVTKTERGYLRLASWSSGFSSSF